MARMAPTIRQADRSGCTLRSVASTLVAGFALKQRGDIVDHGAVVIMSWSGGLLSDGPAGRDR